MSSRSYIIQIVLWHQSDLKVKTWGGDNRHVIPPPMSKHGGIHHPHPSPPPPPRLYALANMCK